MTVLDEEPEYEKWKKCEPDQGESCCYNDIDPYKYCDYKEEDCVSVCLLNGFLKFLMAALTNILHIFLNIRV